MPVISKRAFLTSGVAAATATVAAQFPAPASARAETGQELATLIDIRKCVGCEACVEACPEQVQTIEPRSEILQPARRMAKE